MGKGIQGVACDAPALLLACSIGPIPSTFCFTHEPYTIGAREREQQQGVMQLGLAATSRWSQRQASWVLQLVAARAPANARM